MDILLARLRVWLVRALASAGLLLTLVTFTPLVEWWARKLAGPWDDPRGDVLVVLSAGVIVSGVLDATSQWRTFYAAEAWRQGGFRAVVVTGSDAAPAMKTLLMVYGVPEDAITVEPSARTTRENALLTAPILQRMSGRKVLLTSDYHMYRAIRCFRKAGVSIEPRPFPDAIKQAQGWRMRWPTFVNLVQESAKIAGYGWKDWI